MSSFSRPCVPAGGSRAKKRYSGGSLTATPDTYSGNPLVCAAVLATIHMHQTGEALANARQVSPIIEAGLLRLKGICSKYVRGERTVWSGASNSPTPNRRTPPSWPVISATARMAFICSVPCWAKVICIGPPLIMTTEQARAARSMFRVLIKPVEEGADAGPRFGFHPGGS